MTLEIKEYQGKNLSCFRTFNRVPRYAEIGSADDLAAIRLARLSGCQTLATLHAGERSLPDDITGYFDCVAFLGAGEQAGKIKEIRENS